MYTRLRVQVLGLEFLALPTQDPSLLNCIHAAVTRSFFFIFTYSFLWPALTTAHHNLRLNFSTPVYSQCVASQQEYKSNKDEQSLLSR